jgi:hypothetical protein
MNSEDESNVCPWNAKYLYISVWAARCFLVEQTKVGKNTKIIKRP